MATKKHWSKPQIANLELTPQLAARLRSEGSKATEATERESLHRMADAIEEIIQRRASQHTRRVA